MEGTKENVTHLIMEDAQLDEWGDVYIAARLGERLSISFESFLLHPHRYLCECGQENVPQLLLDGLRPLLPEPERVIQNLHVTFDDNVIPIHLPETNKKTNHRLKSIDSLNHQAQR